MCTSAHHRSIDINDGVATSAPAVGYTVEQLRAQQNDRIFRRAVQNLHAQIIEVTGEHARTHAREM